MWQNVTILLSSCFFVSDVGRDSGSVTCLSFFIPGCGYFRGNWMWKNYSASSIYSWVWNWIWSWRFLQHYLYTATKNIRYGGFWTCFNRKGWTTGWYSRLFNASFVLDSSISSIEVQFKKQYLLISFSSTLFTGWLQSSLRRNEREKHTFTFLH